MVIDCMSSGFPELFFSHKSGIMNTVKKIIVYYHARCADGTGAAWVAWKKFGNRADYRPLEPRRELTTLPRNKDIYILDNSFPAPYFKKLAKAGNRITVIDHHKTSEEDVLLAHNGVFDLNHSASVLAWEYFFPKKPVPKLLLHIEDFDLWRFKISATHEVMSLFSLEGFELVTFKKLATQFEKSGTRAALLKKGKVLKEHEEHLVERLVKNAERVRFAGHEVLAVNSPILNSNIGVRLWHIKGPFSVVWHERNGKRYFSLRCDKDGTFDVSKIAKRIGEGGGHRAAAGFSLPLNKPFPWKVLKS